MIVASDNEATNVLADRLGIQNINEHMWELGLSRTMLGHLLCFNVPRYKSRFNPDGSNITCTDDMALLLRHIYDRSFSGLTPSQGEICREVLSGTSAGYFDAGKFRGREIRTKRGYITDPRAGSDLHEIGIIDESIIICIMLNKIGQKRLPDRSWILPADAIHEILLLIQKYVS
jgi:hypothetical protein